MNFIINKMMKKNTQSEIKNIDECRICGGKSLHRFLHLPQMPLTDDFIPPSHLGHEFLEDINIFVCNDCLTAQTQIDVESRAYYEDYQYSVGNSTKAKRFMKLMAENLQLNYYPKIKGKKILEIGSGDGEQLVAFKETGCRVLGYEPSSELCQLARSKGVPTIQGLFSADSVSTLPEDFKEVDVVFLSFTFDHLPNPKAFLAACHSILNKKNGLLVVEVHDFEKIIKRKEYCLFEHEHSIYLTEATAQKLCESEKFTIINFDLIAEEDRRANSLIFVATPIESQFSLSAATARTPANFHKFNFYEKISADINSGIRNLDYFIANLTEQKKNHSRLWRWRKGCYDNCGHEKF